MRSALENGGFSRSAFSPHHSAEATSRPCCSVWAVKCKSQPRRAGLRGKGGLGWLPRSGTRRKDIFLCHTQSVLPEGFGDMGSKPWGGGGSAVVGKSLECSSLRQKAKQKQTTVSVNTGKLEAWRPSLTQHLPYSMVISKGCRVLDTPGTPFGDPSCRHVCGFLPRLTRIGEAVKQTR